MMGMWWLFTINGEDDSSRSRSLSSDNVKGRGWLLRKLRNNRPKGDECGLGEWVDGWVNAVGE
jgi:hypothetical protein